MVILRIIGPGLCLMAPPPKVKLKGMAKSFSGPCVDVDSVQKMSAIAFSLSVCSLKTFIPYRDCSYSG